MLFESHSRLSRRKLLRQLLSAPLVFRAAPLFAGSLPDKAVNSKSATPDVLPFHDYRVTPHYPQRSPLEDVLRMVRPGSDEYITEQYASEIEVVLKQWSKWLGAGKFDALYGSLSPSFQASSFAPNRDNPLRTNGGINVIRRDYAENLVGGGDHFVANLREWLEPGATIKRADFEITSIHEIGKNPTSMRLEVRYDILTSSQTAYRKQHVGSWTTDWERGALSTNQSDWKMLVLRANSETIASATTRAFVDVSELAFRDAPSYRTQLLRGADYWRSVLDAACGIDIYGNNGIAAGDFDNDGHDDLYVSQPAGLPNRLYRNRGDGTFEDVTEKAGVGVLDNTSCALFADFRNIGLQDLLVVCGNGPLLFINQGDGTFRVQRDAFKFANTPQGTFTHAAIADYDLDGRLDVYFCVYSYYLGLDQYHYPVPYFDARNGPPNFLFHNEGHGFFVDSTVAAGLNVDNDRYSFACAWGQSSPGTHPDLYVVNDFGRNVLYRSKGDGTFTVTSRKAQVEDVGAGMSACWADTTNNGRSDLYVANMWSAAGQRVSEQQIFHPTSAAQVRELYQRHANGNALYLNKGDNTFRRAPQSIGVDAGRWAWCSDFWDFDHDGYADLYVTNGYITAPPQHTDAAVAKSDDRFDLGSFFWRQVVAKSPDDSTPSIAYEHGWNALNELIRSDHSWSGSERNVMFTNNHNGTFSDVSGVVGLDFQEDGRSFALADFDGDGRLEIAVKSRNAPQVRLMHNRMDDLGDSLAVRLRGTQSNRDAIGTSVIIEVDGLRQKKFLQAGSGFLAQHSKEIFFGLGKSSGEIDATIHWPSGVTQQFKALPRNSCISFVEGQANFSARPFLLTSNGYDRGTETMPEIEQAPKDIIETWLIDPLKAPTFTLKDTRGETFSPDSFQDECVLLQFCSVSSQESKNALVALQQDASALKAKGLRVLVLLVDATSSVATARSFAESQRFGFPVLLTTEEVLGTYNIIYRYLFDRRRDLPAPSAFLLNKASMIVKVYQGSVTAAILARDVLSIPTTTAERLRKGLPFVGTLHQSDFLRNDFTYGVAMFQHGYLDQAEASFRQVVSNHPDHAEGFYNLGTLSLRRHDFQAARTYLKEGLRLRANYPEAWNNLGMMAAQEGHTDEAVRSFKQALLLRPTYAVALLNLGNAYRRQGDKEQAKDALHKAFLLQPDDPEANYALGLFYAQSGDLQLAEKYLRQAIYLRPIYPEAINNLGVLLVKRNDYEQAAVEFKACIANAPSFDQSYINLAQLYVLQHNRISARATLRELLLLKPESLSVKQALQALETEP